MKPLSCGSAGLVAPAVAARQEAASAQDALDVAVALHRGELEERDRLAAHSAATHATEVNRLSEQLDEARTAVAAADARAEGAADHRAARAEDANRRTGEHAANTEASLRRLQVDLAKAQAAVASVTTRRGADIALRTGADIALRKPADIPAAHDTGERHDF